MMRSEMDEPTIFTREMIDKFVEKCMHEEILPIVCLKCGKEQFGGFNHHLCDECHFSRYPKQAVKEFHQKFFEYDDG